MLNSCVLFLYLSKCTVNKSFIMKKILLSFLFVFLNTVISAQYIIVDDANHQYINVTVNDTVMTYFENYYYLTRTYDFDIDNDSIQDFQIEAYGYLGGWSHFNYLKLNTYNKFKIHSDTNYIEYCQALNSNYTVIDTSKKVEVVKAYHPRDTIFNNYTNLSNSLYLHFYSRSHIPEYFTGDSINIFTNDTITIAFTKTELNAKYIYFIKVLCYDGSYLKFISAGTDDINILPNNTPGFFPNPATTEINFYEHYDYIEIYDSKGRLIRRDQLQAHKFSYNISFLNEKLYYIKLFIGDEVKSEKLLKL